MEWEHAALEAIAEQGIGAAAIEPLARRLGVTKGSFYWHFPTREALLKAALERRERIDEEEFLGAEPIRDPRERLRALFRRTSREMQSHAVYSALLRALDHASVQPVISRVSHKRIDFLNVAYRQLGLDRSAASYARAWPTPPTPDSCSCRCSWACRVCRMRSSTNTSITRYPP